MGRNKGEKNIMRTPEKKEKIVLEYLNGNAGYETIAISHGVYPSILKRWIKKYRESGIDGLRSNTGKSTNKGKGRYNRHPSEVEKLKRELAKKKLR